MQDNERCVTDLWRDYENGLAYQSNLALDKKIPQFVRFYEGEQWPKATERTKSLPRPVVNIVKMICRNKKSRVLSTSVKILYKSEAKDADVQLFNDFAEYIQKEIGQNELDIQAMDDGVIKGSYFYHYYWDTEARGKRGIKEGGVRCELIDALDIFFADPTELDEQKQRYIIIVSREDIDSVRAKCDKGVDIDMIQPDSVKRSAEKYGVAEQNESKLCTVLTRYFRKDGEVYCEKATKTSYVNEAFPLSPDLEAARSKLGFAEDAPNNALPDRYDKDSLSPKSAKATLYPIVVGNYERREKCIYGLSEVEGIIPNQKAINFIIAMALLNAQEMAWGKYIAIPGALKNQVITNEPGQVLIDYTRTGTGIKKMTEQGMQGMPLQIIDTLTQLTRVCTGSSEVMTGEALGASMSGAAIAQLQSQAQQPIEDLKRQFWHVKEKQGKVLAQFFKLFYEDKTFSAEQRKGVGGEMEKRTEIFNGSVYADTDFEVVVEATTGTRSSAAGDIALIENLHAKGAIDTLTMIRVYPDDALANKQEIIRGIQEAEQNHVRVLTAQNEQLKAMAEQLKQQLQESATVIQKQRETVDKVQTLMRENNQLKSLLVEVFNEAKTKIGEANRQIEIGNQAYEETRQDASDFATVIDNMMHDSSFGTDMPKTA